MRKNYDFFIAQVLLHQCFVVLGALSSFHPGWLIIPLSSFVKSQYHGPTAKIKTYRLRIQLGGGEGPVCRVLALFPCQKNQNKQIDEWIEHNNPQWQQQTKNLNIKVLGLPAIKRCFRHWTEKQTRSSLTPIPSLWKWWNRPGFFFLGDLY